MLWYSSIPIAMFGLHSGIIFYANEFEKPAIWIAIYAACMKSLWGIFGATIVLGSALNTGCKNEKKNRQLFSLVFCCCHQFFFTSLPLTQPLKEIVFHFGLLRLHSICHE